MKQKKVLSLPVYIAIYAVVILACIGLDQLTKFLIFDGVLAGRVGNSVSVIGDFMRFTAVYNDGCIFGLFTGTGADIAFFIITVAATPLYLYFLMRSRKRSVWGQIGFAFIVGGALGNAIDRAFVNVGDTFFSGRVRDFISFSIFPPVFNVADSFLTVGVVMAVLAIVVFDPDSLMNVMREERLAKLVGEDGGEFVVEDDVEDDNTDNADSTQPEQQTTANNEAEQPEQPTTNADDDSVNEQTQNAQTPDNADGQGTDKK